MYAGRGYMRVGLASVYECTSTIVAYYECTNIAPSTYRYMCIYRVTRIFEFEKVNYEYEYEYEYVEYEKL